MPGKVFISHAGPDTPQAMKVAEVLSYVGIDIVLDREEVKPGNNFIRFMETALTECDYCLLLWSQVAAQREWVQIEWEAALYRTVQRSQTFLVVGRLELYPLPLLLAPRRAADLFPTLHPGIDELIQLWRDDSTAAEMSDRRIGPANVPLEEDKNGETVYITSDLFALTMPLQLDLTLPVGIHLDRLITYLKLPRQFDYEGRLGIRYEYRLVQDGTALVRGKSLAIQGVKYGSILWLEVEMMPFAAITPTQGELVSATFRGDEKTERTQAKKAARNQLLTSISSVGLGI
jgi:hypothetical protein